MLLNGKCDLVQDAANLQSSKRQSSHRRVDEMKSGLVATNVKLAFCLGPRGERMTGSAIISHDMRRT